MTLITTRKLFAAAITHAIMLVCAFPFNGTAQHVEGYAAFDSLEVGDKITFSLTLNKDQSYDKVIYPDSSNINSNFEIRSSQLYKLNEFKDSLVYKLQFFATEDARLPRLPVSLIKEGDTTTLYTKPVPVYFKSVLKSEEENFRPFKPIFDFASAWWPYLLALAILAAAGWYLYQIYQKEEAEPEIRPTFEPEPFRDPLDKLANNIKQLKNFSFSSEKDFKQFYVKLGDAIRTYFEDLYHIPALESTSREILQDLKKRSIDKELAEHTRQVLNEADMVKFANFTPTEEQANLAQKKAQAFLKKARQLDGSKVDRLRDQYRSAMERKRRAFKQQKKEEQL